MGGEEGGGGTFNPETSLPTGLAEDITRPRPKTPQTGPVARSASARLAKVGLVDRARRTLIHARTDH